MDKILKATLEMMTQGALEIALCDLRLNRRVNPIVLIQGNNGKYGKVDFPEELGDMLNHPEAKAAFFSAVKTVAQAEQCRVIVFASETWTAKATKAGEALSGALYLRMMEERGFETARKMGLCERFEAVSVVAQSREYVLVTSQLFERGEDGEITLGERIAQGGAQSDFHGHMKLFDSEDGGRVQ